MARHFAHTYSVCEDGSTQRTPNGQYERVRRLSGFSRIALLAVVVPLAACSSSSAHSTGNVGTPRDPSAAGLRAAATAYAYAYLRGTPSDLLAVIDPAACATSPSQKAKLKALPRAALLGELAKGLNQFRSAFERLAAMKSDRVTVKHVIVRNVARGHGEAEALYGLPSRIQGNDNWNTYAYRGGSWRIAGCDSTYPIGGNSGSVSASATGSTG